MAKNRLICHCNEVGYIDIRKAMIAGARTIEEIGEMTGAGTVCGGCLDEIKEILASVCGCSGTSVKDVIVAVECGAKDVEAVGRLTKAGVEDGCGRCKPLIQNIIDTGK